LASPARTELFQIVAAINNAGVEEGRGSLQTATIGFGRARHSVRAVVGLRASGGPGIARPAFRSSLVRHAWRVEQRGHAVNSPEVVFIRGQVFFISANGRFRPPAQMARQIKVAKMEPMRHAASLEERETMGLNQSNRLALKVALAYVIVSVSWILCSDEVVKWLVRDADERTTISILKGWGFVLVTGALLFQVLRRSLQRWEQEMTQRKQAEAARQDSEERYRRLFAVQNDAVLLMDYQANQILDVNPAAEKMYGYSRAEFLRLDPVQISHEPEKTRKAIATEVRHIPLRMHQRKDGTVFPVEISCSDFLYQGRNLHVAAMRDITRRQQAEDELLKSRQRYHDLFEHMNEGFAYCRMIFEDGQPKDFVYLTVNEKFGSLTGLKDVAGKRATEVIPGIRECDPELLEIYGRVAKTGKPERFERFVVSLHLWFDIAVYSPEPDHFVAVFDVITERKQAEEALQTSELRYRRLFETAKDGILILDADTGLIVDVNPYLINLLNFPREQFVGKKVWELGFFKDILANQAHFAELQQKEYIRYEDLPLQTAHGWRADVEFVSSVYQVDHSRVMQCNIRDITARKQAEDELRWKTALLEAQVDSTLDGILVVDPQGKKILQNQRMNELWKIPPQIAEDKDNAAQLQFVTGQAKNPRQFAEKATYLYAHPDEISRDEIELIDGTIFDRYSSPVRDKAGKHYGRIWTFRDITENKRGEARMHLQLSALTAVANAIVITDGNGIIEWVNPAFTQLTGYTAEEAIGKNPRVLKSGQHPPEFYAQMWQTIIAGQVWQGEVVNKRKDDRLYTEEMTITPVRGADGQIAHFVAVKQDVTERRQIESRLRQSQKMDAIGQLAGGVAHDFNNILAVIQLQAGLLKTEQSLSPAQLEYAGDIEQAAQRGANLSRQLQLFSRKQALQLRDLDLNDVISNIAKMLQRILTEDIRLKQQLSAQSLLIHADAGMMDQILLNLVVNARDAMPHGGQLIIEISAVEFDDVTAAQTSLGRPGSFVCLYVSDSGCGIPPENLPKIFEPFFTTKELGKGTGLGLATVFSIVQQHQGWINVYSEAGQGTTFRIYLPRLTRPVDKKAAWASLASIRNGHETVLLAEDDVSTRAAVRSVLTRFGYRVLEAATGVEALAVWQQQRGEIQLLLTDMVMPGGMNGKELAHRLLQENPKLKVIYASGYNADIASKGLVLQEGVNFLTKPFEAHKLAQTVRHCLDAV
jgi:PAS domain S-box-containing protein